MVETLNENLNNQVYRMTHLFLSFRNEQTSHETGKEIMHEFSSMNSQ